MDEQTKLKEILLNLVREIEDLKSNQALLFARVIPPIKVGEARDAKELMANALKQQYATLRKQIEELS
jgi:hypothetical protein